MCLILVSTAEMELRAWNVIEKKIFCQSIIHLGKCLNILWLFPCLNQISMLYYVKDCKYPVKRQKYYCMKSSLKFEINFCQQWDHKHINALFIYPAQSIYPRQLQDLEGTWLCWSSRWRLLHEEVCKTSYLYMSLQLHVPQVISLLQCDLKMCLWRKK